MMYDFGLVGGEAYIDGEFRKVNVYIKGETISEISAEDLPCKEKQDITGKKLLPGLIDPHVHFDLDLGKIRSRDDFDSGSKAALAGGITTIIDFLSPINDPESYREAFETRKKEAKGCHTDYSFHLTLGNFRGDIGSVIAIAKEDGIASAKIFTTYSESGRRITFKKIEELMKTGILVLAHAECDELVDPDWKDIPSYEDSRPLQAEINAVNMLVEILKGSSEDASLYIVHTSGGSTIEKQIMLNPALVNTRIFFESCPHYFTFDKSVYEGMSGPLFMMAPPLRRREEAEKLKSLIDRVDTIGTDHCSFYSGDKLEAADARYVPKGIGGVEHSFRVMYTLFGDKVIEKYTSRPAEIFGLKKKGRIEVGLDADLVVLNDKTKDILSLGMSKSDYDVFEGMKVRCNVEMTMLRGEVAYDGKEVKQIKGRYIKRNG